MTAKTDSENTIPREYLLSAGVPADIIGAADPVDITYLRVVAAILIYAAQPVSLPAMATLPRLKGAAKRVCALEKYTPRPFPQADQKRDNILCGSLFVMSFPKLGRGALSAVVDKLTGGLAAAYWLMSENFHQAVAARLPPLAAAAKAWVPPIAGPPIILEAKQKEAFEAIGQAVTTVVDRWVEAEKESAVETWEWLVANHGDMVVSTKGLIDALSQVKH